MKHPLDLIKILGVVALVVSLLGCDDSDSSNSTTGVRGSVSDTFGSALSGVTVALGDATDTTDKSSEFEVNAEDGEQLIIRFSKDGYIATQKRVDVRKGVETSISAICTTMARMASFAEHPPWILI